VLPRWVMYGRDTAANAPTNLAATTVATQAQLVPQEVSCWMLWMMRPRVSGGSPAVSRARFFGPSDLTLVSQRAAS
jgi:hypothetical protein